jgi:hypothetical protein
MDTLRERDTENLNFTMACFEAQETTVAPERLIPAP